MTGPTVPIQVTRRKEKQPFEFMTVFHAKGAFGMKLQGTGQAACLLLAFSGMEIRLAEGVWPSSGLGGSTRQGHRAGAPLVIVPVGF